MKYSIESKTFFINYLMVINVFSTKFIPYLFVMVVKETVHFQIKKLNLGFLSDNNLVIHKSEFVFSGIKKNLLS